MATDGKHRNASGPAKKTTAYENTAMEGIISITGHQRSDGLLLHLSNCPCKFEKKSGTICSQSALVIAVSLRSNSNIFLFHQIKCLLTRKDLYC